MYCRCVGHDPIGKQKFPPAGSDVETVMNGLCIAVWAEAFRHQSQWEKPLPPYVEADSHPGLLSRADAPVPGGWEYQPQLARSCLLT